VPRRITNTGQTLFEFIMPPSDQDIRNRLLVVRLPTLPHILLKLIEYCSKETIGMADLSELISKDPAISAKILGVANSSAYHRSGHQVRLEQSLMTLGTDMIRTLVISESVFQTFSSFTTSTTVSMCKFWIHSLTNAVLAREIARKIGYINIDEAYLCGLLHDVGRLAFLVISPNLYGQHFQADDDADLCATEQQVLHISHSEAGAWLMDRWKLGQNASDSVLYHHETISRLETTEPLVRIIYLSHILSSQPWDTTLATQAARLCNLKPEDLAVIQGGAEKKVRESAEFLGINLDNHCYTSSQEKSLSQTQSPTVHKKLKDELHQVVQTSETERNFSKQTSEPALLRTVSQSANILFQIEDAIILMLDTSSQMLAVSPGSEYQPQLLGYSLRVKSGGTIANAISQKRPAFIRRNSFPTPEDALMNLLHTDTLVCIPLTSGGQCLGVLIGRTSHLKIAELKENIVFMQVFSSQAANALLSLRQKNEQLQNVNVAIDEFRLSSRKIVHEANNPLTVIKNYLNVLNEKLRRQEPIGGEISILHEEIDRVGKIISKFVTPQSSDAKGMSDVNKIIDDIARMLRDSGFAPTTVKIVTQFNKEASATDCDDGKIWQILLNLLKNAIEAMPNGGEISITNNGHIKQDELDYIALSVKDTGTGLPKQVLENLFSPVTSTKGGTHQGLGLSIVQDLVKELNGLITCQSSSSGTLFEILLPVHSSVTQTTPSAKTK
jgi:HD-like signal output (HDOD) protein/signal transduction histidine kinase